MGPVTQEQNLNILKLKAWGINVHLTPNKIKHTSQLWEEGTISSSFLPVKMSIPTKWHLACPCLPVLEVETSTTCWNGKEILKLDYSRHHVNHYNKIFKVLRNCNLWKAFSRLRQFRMTKQMFKVMIWCISEAKGTMEEWIWSYSYYFTFYRKKFLEIFMLQT